MHVTCEVEVCQSRELAQLFGQRRKAAAGEIEHLEFFQRRNLGGNRLDSSVTDQLEMPQLCEGAERLGEAGQPRFLLMRPIVTRVKCTQRQLLEAPCELPEGLDVGLGSVNATDDERAQPAGGDDRGPQ